MGKSSGIEMPKFSAGNPLNFSPLSMASSSGLLGDITGANAAQRAAQAQERAANSQLGFQKEQFADARKTRERAFQEAAASPQELMALERSLAQQTQSLDKQASLFEALDPAIMEASSQALQLLRGEESRTLAPLKSQRDRQRQTLLNTLREQMGPGAETSSAGQQALQNFDQQTSDILNQGQQQSLSQLFSMGQSGAVNRGSLNQGIGQLANIGSAFGNINTRRTNALLGGQSGVANANQGVLTAGQGVIGSAGSKFTADALNGQFITGLIKGGTEAGAQAGAAAAFSDKNVKTNIENADNQIQELLASVSANKFDYKNTEHGEGKHYGPMAQELETTEIGKTVVIETPDGKMVNYGKLIPAVLSALGHINRRLDALEKHV